MSVQKTYTQLIDEAHYQSHLGPERPFPTARKYKKNNFMDPDFDAELGPGKRLIIAQHEGKFVKGYMLATIIDIDDSEKWWTSRTAFIVEINEVSNDILNDHINRLRVVSGFQKNWYSGNRHIVEIGKANWDNYKVNQ